MYINNYYKNHCSKVGVYTILQVLTFYRYFNHSSPPDRIVTVIAVKSPSHEAEILMVSQKS